jgi:monovalent cation/proton antiporter MnhG/PhaG subunit
VSIVDVLVWLLLAVGVGVQLVCCLSLLAVRGAYDQLHFTAPAGTIGPVALALAVVVDEPAFSQSWNKAILVAVLMVGLNPILVHAIARAGRVREHGSWRLLPEERRPAEEA